MQKVQHFRGTHDVECLAMHAARQPADIGLRLRVRPELRGVALPSSLQILAVTLDVYHRVTLPSSLQTWRSAESSTGGLETSPHSGRSSAFQGWLRDVQRIQATECVFAAVTWDVAHPNKTMIAAPSR